MYREIINDIPLRLVKPKYEANARRQLVKYAEAAQRMIESRAASSENRKLVKWHAEDALEWMRRQRNASYEDYLVSYNTVHFLSQRRQDTCCNVVYTVGLKMLPQCYFLDSLKK